MKQANRIHHRCRCLDRNFTFEEWCEYLRANPSGGAVLTVGTFNFNITDICLTPNKPVRIEGRICKLEISTAQSLNGRWEFGIDLGLNTEGRHFGVSFVDDISRGFQTEKEAIYAGLLFAEEKTVPKIDEIEMRGNPPDDYDDEESGRQPKPSAVLSSLRGFLKEIQRYKQYYDPKQLNLFDI